MKRKIALCILCLFFVLPGAIAEEMVSTDNLLPVVVVLYDEASEDVSIDLLLIIIHKSTGRAMKMTLQTWQCSILRRAQKRGKALPGILKAALERQAESY